jgi:hypothetical protein
MYGTHTREALLYQLVLRPNLRLLKGYATSLFYVTMMTSLIHLKVLGGALLLSQLEDTLVYFWREEVPLHCPAKRLIDKPPTTSSLHSESLISIPSGHFAQL